MMKADNLKAIGRSDAAYPVALETFLGKRPPESLFALGNMDILHQKTFALFCSVKCPGNLILKTYDLARELRDTGTVVISGFHSPMEKECLSLLLRGKQPIIWCQPSQWMKYARRNMRGYNKSRVGSPDLNKSG